MPGVSPRARGTVARTHTAEDVGHWSARCNLVNQENLLFSINTVSEMPIETVAERLGIEVEEAEAALEGRVDLTLTELRLLGVASEVIINYHVSPARRDYGRWLHHVAAWHEKSALETGDRPEALDPALVVRRAVAAG